MKHLTVALLLVVACGGGEEPETVEPATTTGAETTTTVERAPVAFVIAPFTLTDSGGQSAQMSADGMLTVPDAPTGPTFTAEGRIEVDGDHVGTMAEDGTLTTADGQMIAVIAEDGSTTVGEYNLSFGPDGVLIGGNPDGPSMTLAPADSPAKRLAMAVLIMMTMGVEVSTEPAQVTPSEAAAPTPGAP